MPIGFRDYISEETLTNHPYYPVLTRKGKDHRKNVIRFGTYKTRKEARQNALAYAQKYNLNIRVFDLNKRRKR